MKTSIIFQMQKVQKFVIKLCFLLALSTYSCVDNKKEPSQDLYNELFETLIEEVFQDSRKIFIPPRPPKNNSEEELEKMEMAFKIAEKKHKKYLDTTQFAPLIVVVNDTITSISKSRLNEIKKTNTNFKTSTKSPFKINLDNIKLNKNYILKYKSELKQPIDKMIWNEYDKERHLRQYSGVLYLSKIYFNSENSSGFFEAGFSCGKLCSSTYLIFIEKENNKWRIVNKKNLNFS